MNSVLNLICFPPSKIYIRFEASDYKIRKDAILSKRYLEGRYGGIPYLHDGYLEKSINMVKEGNYPSSEEQNGHKES